MVEYDEKIVELFRKNKDKFGHSYTLKEFVEMCQEWDAVCEKIRKYAGRE